MRNRKFIALFAAAAMMMPGAASAASQGNNAQTSGTPSNCWGVVSSQLAQYAGGLGAHTSSQSEPRLGLGNVARLFYSLGFISEPTVAALGAYLADIDGIDETSCPAE